MIDTVFVTKHLLLIWWIMTFMLSSWWAIIACFSFVCQGMISFGIFLFNLNLCKLCLYQENSPCRRCLFLCDYKSLGTGLCTDCHFFCNVNIIYRWMTNYLYYLQWIVMYVCLNFTCLETISCYLSLKWSHWFKRLEKKKKTPLYHVTESQLIMVSWENWRNSFIAESLQ